MAGKNIKIVPLKLDAQATIFLDFLAKTALDYARQKVYSDLKMLDGRTIKEGQQPGDAKDDLRGTSKSKRLQKGRRVPGSDLKFQGEQEGGAGGSVSTM